MHPSSQTLGVTRQPIPATCSIMNSPSAHIHITKLAAAQRQLRAAIRLYFMEEDDLAIHTVASAAYKLVADLKAERGMNEAADHHLTSVFYVVRDYRRGTLPKHIAENAELMAWVASMAEQLPIGPDTKLSDITASLDPGGTKRFWNQQNQAANFLKHADRDVKAHLDLEHVNNLLLLTQALASYTDLVKGDLGAEGLILWLYTHAEHEDHQALQEKFRPIGRRIAQVPGAQRRLYCSALIFELNSKASPE